MDHSLARKSTMTAAAGIWRDGKSKMWWIGLLMQPAMQLQLVRMQRDDESAVGRCWILQQHRGTLLASVPVCCTPDLFAFLEGSQSSHGTIGLLEKEPQLNHGRLY